ncbi:hypothetical protein RND71_011939 [Anisodus tanguticus]|uniref:Plant heme peroxidase family profile domain-containing protein n=1 Tax=Anisodus tanguticus TaxID=243964 RepID=A0AAE1SET8_9SOLA|nr:hypothetical protein RND71_011939 [Anisodus tanguticus]
MAPRIDVEYRNEIDKARVDLLNLIWKDKYSATDLLRLAYASQFSIANSHNGDAGNSTSTDATTKTTQSANNNNNLKTAIDNIKAKHPTITYPDLYQLAGVVALETLGGPKIEFVPGRKDSQISPNEGCLPDGKQGASDLRDVFHRVGLSDDKDIVALSGGLKLVTLLGLLLQARRADSEISGVHGHPTGETLKFDNSYFEELANKKDSSLLTLPTDKALLDDKKFRGYVQLYATNKDAFKKDFEEAHKKLSELGLPHASFFRSTLEKSTLVVKNIPVAQRAVGVAVAAAVVIFSVFYLINRRRANKYSLNQFQ